jgi:putative redox protein
MASATVGFVVDAPLKTRFGPSRRAESPSQSGPVDGQHAPDPIQGGRSMSTRTATARLDGDGLRLVAESGSGHRVVMDTADGDRGPRPAELLMIAQAGCTAMDVVSILRKKRQHVTRYEVRVAGDQRDDPHPHVFERIRIIHVVEGDVAVEAVRRAIELSATRYCTVTANLASGVAEIRHAYVVRDVAGEEHYGEVAVTGPLEAPTGPQTDVAAGPAERRAAGPAPA